MIKIDKNIPLPEQVYIKYKCPERVSPTSKYPWKVMEVGDSFLVKGKTARTFRGTSNANTQYAPKRFIAKTIEDGVRIWRLE